MPILTSSVLINLFWANFCLDHSGQVIFYLIDQVGWLQLAWCVTMVTLAGWSPCQHGERSCDRKIHLSDMISFSIFAFLLCAGLNDAYTRLRHWSLVCDTHRTHFTNSLSTCNWKSCKKTTSCSDLKVIIRASCNFACHNCLSWLDLIIRIKITWNCYDANFVITGGTGGCHYNNTQWWRQSWHHDNCTTSSFEALNDVSTQTSIVCPCCVTPSMYIVESG